MVAIRIKAAFSLETIYNNRYAKDGINNTTNDK